MAPAPRQVPKTYPAGTGRPTERKLTDDKVVRTVNVPGTVWEAGKERAVRDEVSVSHAVGLFIEAYAAGLLDLDVIVAQLDELADNEHQALTAASGFSSPHPWQNAENLPSGLTPPPVWQGEAPNAFDPYPRWGPTDDTSDAFTRDDAPRAFDILDEPQGRP
ncbi:hypothetical protein [Streptomyces sp. NPDC055005]